MSFVAVGLLWRWMYNPVFGLFDFILQGLGLTHTPVGWLSNPHIALWSVVIVENRKRTGYHTVIFLAGLQTIPNALYEAAEVDRACLLRRIAHVTLPSIRSITIINITIALMGAFSVFDLSMSSRAAVRTIFPKCFSRTCTSAHSRSRSSDSGRQWSLCFSLSSY